MKRKLIIIPLITLASFVVSCSSDPKPTKKPTLESISLSGSYKTTFIQNEVFNYEGLVVTAHYSDESSEVVENYQVSTPDMSVLGNQDVTVTYLTASRGYTINISEPDPSRTLSSISLSGNYQTVFTVNEEFNYNRLIVTAHYSDGAQEVVTPTSVTAPDMSQLGEQTITVTYLGVSTSYTINISADDEDLVGGYIRLEHYELNILLGTKTAYQLLPAVIINGEVDSDKSFSCSADVTNLVKVKPYTGSIYPLTDGGTYQTLGTCTVTVQCVELPKLTAKCIVHVVSELPTKQYEYRRVDNYDSLKDKDILVIAAPTHGETASLDTLHSKLNTVSSTFNSDKSKITSLGESTAEFYLGIETDKYGDTVMTLEAQNGQYLVCTHEGKVKLDASSNTNKYWDIHSNVDPETGEGDITDGAVIENNLASLGYLMFNVSLHYFTTYVDNSLRPDIMELPFLYRLEEINL